jgi:hypothetical protein
LSGCFSGNFGSDLDTDGGGDSASVSIEAFSVSPTTVADGESFEVTWSVKHTSSAGYFTQMGLYMGEEAGLDTADERDARALFSVAATAGAPSDPSSSSMTCTRTGNNLKCDTPGSGSRTVTAGAEMQVTFRACNSYVLDTEEVCDFESVALSFP